MTEVTAQVQEQEQEQVDVELDETNEVEVNSKVSNGPKRQKKVNVNIEMPFDDVKTGKISLEVVESGQVIDYVVDLTKFNEDFLMAAVIGGLTSRLSIAYGPVKTATEIVEAIQSELNNFDANIYNARFSTKSENLTIKEIVLAWMEVRGEDTNDLPTLTRYSKAWEGFSDERKTQISTHEAVIRVHERNLMEKRLARKVKDANVDNAVLAV